jgi:hypothetical protein
MMQGTMSLKFSELCLYTGFETFSNRDGLFKKAASEVTLWLHSASFRWQMLVNLLHRSDSSQRAAHFSQSPFRELDFRFSL